jgi:hypothetical protein
MGDPSGGNLLFDYRGTLAQAGTPPFDGFFSRLDAFDLSGDGTARVYGMSTDSSGTMDTVGLTTRFEFTLIPEPATFFLLLVGAGPLWLVRAHVRKQKAVCR